MVASDLLSGHSMSFLIPPKLRSLPSQGGRIPVLLAPDPRGSFARERAVARPVTAGSGRSIEDAILNLIEGDAAARPRAEAA